MLRENPVKGPFEDPSNDLEKKNPLHFNFLFLFLFGFSMFKGNKQTKNKTKSLLMIRKNSSNK